MGRKLNRTVLAGGVVYPAGTPATDELEASITNPEFWSGRSDGDDKPEASPAPAHKRAAKRPATKSKGD